MADRIRTSRLLSARLSAFAVSIAIIALSLSSGPSAGAAASLHVGYFTGLIAEPETVIGSVPSLASQIPANISWVPVTAGVAALAEVQAGGLDLVAGVGNPPTVASIANGTPIEVIWAQSLDSDSLIVSKSIKTPSALQGKTLGDLEGSSEDYEIRGWLTKEHLTGKVSVVGFQSEQAVAAAWLAHKIDAAYVAGALEINLTQHGGVPLTNAKKIAALGYPGLNVLAVTQSLVKSNPALVQKYVCAEMKATNDLFGPQRNKYFKSSSNLLGVPPAQAVQATQQYLSYYITPSQQKQWLEGSDGTTATSPTVVAYETTAKFDVAQGRITSAPTVAQLAAHINPKFALNAVAGHCS